MNQVQIDDSVDLIINGSSDQYIENPYTTFEKIRSFSPIVRNSRGLWVTTGYRHTKKLMMSKAFGRSDMYRVAPFEDMLSPVEKMRKAWMLYCDPPKHTQIKQLSMNILNSQMNDLLSKRISDVSEFLISIINKKISFDIVEDYAYPLPLLVIAELLGVPKEDRHAFKKWSALINKTLEPCCSLEEKKKSDKIVTDLYNYFENLINEKLIEGSMLEDLVKASKIENGLTKDEVIYTAMLLLIAGHETTSSMTTLGMLALLRNPDKYNQLRNFPGLIEKSVDELLRYDAPVQMARRIALEDTELLNTPIRKGEMVMGVFGAANYDPEQFHAPWVLDFSRKNSHLSFGIGSHYCLGTSLAREEGKIIFRDLLTKIPFLKLNEHPIVRKKNVMLRGLDLLPVSLEHSLSMVS